MSRIASYMSAAGAIVERDVMVFISYRARVISQLFGSGCLSMVIFYGLAARRSAVVLVAGGVTSRSSRPAYWSPTCSSRPS